MSPSTALDWLERVLGSNPACDQVFLHHFFHIVDEHTQLPAPSRYLLCEHYGNMDCRLTLYTKCSRRYSVDSRISSLVGICFCRRQNPLGSIPT